MEGVIKKLLADKKCGFIRGAEKDYFFHFSALKNCRFEALFEGQEVSFEDSEGPQGKGPRAEDIYAN